MCENEEKFLTYEEKVIKTLAFLKTMLVSSHSKGVSVTIEVNSKGNSIHISHWTKNHTEVK